MALAESVDDLANFGVVRRAIRTLDLVGVVDADFPLAELPHGALVGFFVDRRRRNVLRWRGCDRAVDDFLRGFGVAHCGQLLGFLERLFGLLFFERLLLQPFGFPALAFLLVVPRDAFFADRFYRRLERGDERVF